MVPWQYLTTHKRVMLPWKFQENKRLALPWSFYDQHKNIKGAFNKLDVLAWDIYQDTAEAMRELTLHRGKNHPSTVGGNVQNDWRARKDEEEKEEEEEEEEEDYNTLLKQIIGVTANTENQDGYLSKKATSRNKRIVYNKKKEKTGKKDSILSRYLSKRARPWNRWGAYYGEKKGNTGKKDSVLSTYISKRGPPWNRWQAYYGTDQGNVGEKGGHHNTVYQELKGDEDDLFKKIKLVPDIEDKVSYNENRDY